MIAFLTPWLGRIGTYAIALLIGGYFGYQFGNSNTEIARLKSELASTQTNLRAAEAASKVNSEAETELRNQVQSDQEKLREYQEALARQDNEPVKDVPTGKPTVVVKTVRVPVPGPPARCAATDLDINSLRGLDSHPSPPPRKAGVHGSGKPAGH